MELIKQFALSKIDSESDSKRIPSSSGMLCIQFFLKSSLYNKKKNWTKHN